MAVGFKKSLFGFNRKNVVEYINSTHMTFVENEKKLNEQIEPLNEELKNLNTQLNVLNTEKIELENKILELNNKYTELEDKYNNEFKLKHQKNENVSKNKNDDNFIIL